LHSERFAQLTDELSKRYDLVIYDTPPVLTVTDAVVLGRRVDGMILVARGGNTKQAALRSAAEQLASVGIRMLGVVLNDVDLSRRAYAYYYYRDYRAYDAYRYTYGSTD